MSSSVINFMFALISCLLTTILTICSSITCALPPSTSTSGSLVDRVLPTPWQPWTVRNNTVCILAKFGAEFVVNTTKTETKIIVNPLTARVGNESKCGPDLQVLQLDFDGNSLSLSFKKDDQNIFVSKIVFRYGSAGSVVYNGSLFKTPLKFGYKCFNEQTITLSQFIRMNVENVRLEAFKEHNYAADDEIPEPWERIGLKCELDKIKSNAWQISSISVGVGIAVLSFFTLVAIWSGRRQEKSMLKVKMMRQWTVEENLAYLARLGAVHNKKSPVKKEFAGSNNGLDNLGYANSESQKF